MNHPYFTIVIPCYNHADFLPEAVESLIKQDFTSWEAIIVNDGSNDNSLTIAESLSKKDGRIAVFNKKNQGLSAARNDGKKMAVGQYLLFLDADDFVFEGCLKRVYECGLRDRPGLIRVGYSYCKGPENKIIQSVLPNSLDDPLKSIIKNNLGPCQSIFIDNNLARVIGDFDEELKSAEDWDYWARALKAGGILTNLLESLVCYRYVSASMSRDAFRMYESLKTVATRISEPDRRISRYSNLNIHYEVDLSATLKEKLITCLGVSVMQGKIDESVEMFKREANYYRMSISPRDFACMYSYLSFRYWNEPRELGVILGPIYENYRMFFKKIALSQRDQDKALNSVFNPVKMIRNRQTYGRLVGGVINRLFIR